MKNIISLLAGIILVSCHVSAQISLTAADYPSSLTGTDSLKITTAASAFPVLTPTVSGMWDMSVVTDTAPVFFAYRVPTSTYQFADSNFYSFSSFKYQGNVQCSIVTHGLLEYGVNIQRVAYSLAAITFGPTDSLIINAQNILYSTPRNKIAFPATYNSSWASIYHFDIAFRLTATVLSLNDTPGSIRRYITEKDSVIGWGKMRIKDAVGSPSAYLNVLQVQTTIITTDSLFVNGAPAAGFVVSALGLTQGKTDTTYQQNYYRPQEVTALAQVDFKDAAFVQPYRAKTHVQRLIAVGIAGVANETSIKVFPNPIKSGILTIELPTDEKTAYELFDIAGRNISSGLLQPKNKMADILLPFSAQPGTYYLRLSNDGKSYTQPIEISK